MIRFDIILLILAHTLVGIPIDKIPIDSCHSTIDRNPLILVATTAGSSAAGVELPTDDCRQPTGITDENSFFFL
jgi:hypothetical protein